MQTRNTIQRQIVLQTVQQMHDHPTADAVYEVVSSQHPSVSKATVYRNLNQLAIQGVIQRVPLPNGADRFDFRTDDHYHVRCIGCGAVFDVNMPYIRDLVGQIEEMPDIRIERYNLLFEGRCKQCLGKEALMEAGGESTAL